jgi:hypothetical protein
MLAGFAAHSNSNTQETEGYHIANITEVPLIVSCGISVFIAVIKFKLISNIQNPNPESRPWQMTKSAGWMVCEIGLAYGENE